MAAGSGDGVDDSISLLNTPTWAIACACGIFIVFSLIVERIIHHIGISAAKYNHAAFLQAFDKMKDELLMVGILSLALAMGQKIFSKACVPVDLYQHARLCKGETEKTAKKAYTSMHWTRGRELAAASGPSSCKADEVQFMTSVGMHDLHIYVFTLAAVHILYSVIIIGIGMWVVGSWKVWEARGVSTEEVATKGGARITHQTTFIQRRAANKWFQNPVGAYVAAFFKQFFRPVIEADFMALRGGFIKSHFAESPNFNFYKYILRSFQDDFKHVVGISPALWLYAIIWLLANVNGWESHIAVSLVPLLLVLVIGTKLQYILTQMANEIQQQNVVVMGAPLVSPNDKHFWFGRPRYILKCIHFIVFQNALNTTYAVWGAVTFSSENCVYGNYVALIKRVVIGLFVQVLCGVTVLPIYALISQMGSRLKKTIFNEDVNAAMSRWKVRAKKTSVHGSQAHTSPGPTGTNNSYQHEVQIAPDESHVATASH